MMKTGIVLLTALALLFSPVSASPGEAGGSQSGPQPVAVSASSELPEPDPSTSEVESEPQEPDPPASETESDPQEPNPPASETESEPQKPDPPASQTESEPQEPEPPASGAESEPQTDIPPEAPVMSVALPTEISIILDPLELGGKGQVYSEPCTISNTGETDVQLTLTDIRCVFANDTDFEPLLQPVDEQNPGLRKSIFLMLVFSRPDLPDVIVTDPAGGGSTAVTLQAAGNGDASLLELSFTGSINYAPAKAWQSGDVKIQITYQMEPVPAPQGSGEPPAAPPDIPGSEGEAQATAGALPPNPSATANNGVSGAAPLSLPPPEALPGSLALPLPAARKF